MRMSEGTVPVASQSSSMGRNPPWYRIPATYVVPGTSSNDCRLLQVRTTSARHSHSPSLTRSTASLSRSIESPRTLLSAVFRIRPLLWVQVGCGRAGNRHSGERHASARVRALRSIAPRGRRKHPRERRVAHRRLPNGQVAPRPVDESVYPHRPLRTCSNIGFLVTGLSMGRLHPCSTAQPSPWGFPSGMTSLCALEESSLRGARPCPQEHGGCRVGRLKWPRTRSHFSVIVAKGCTHYQIQDFGRAYGPPSPSRGYSRIGVFPAGRSGVGQPW